MASTLLPLLLMVMNIYLVTYTDELLLFLFFTGLCLLNCAQLPRCRTTPSWQSMVAYTTYPKPNSISGFRFLQSRSEDLPCRSDGRRNLELTHLVCCNANTPTTCLSNTTCIYFKISNYMFGLFTGHHQTVCKIK